MKFSTLVELLRYRAIHQPQQVAYTFLTDGEGKGVSLTYGELDQHARAIAVSLQELNLIGARALLLYPPGLDYILAFFGCLYAGVVAVPAYPPRLNRPTPQVQAIAADSQPAIALSATEVITRIQSRLEHTPPALQSIRWQATDQFSAAMASDWREPTLSDESLAFLQYTSGATSAPKGVMVSHRNLLHNLELIRRAFQIDPNGLGVSWLPMYHDMGLIGSVLEALYMGGPCVLMPPTAFVEKPVRWLQAITRHRATISGAPNFAYDLCVEKITPSQRATLDLSRWQTAFCGAEPIRSETLERFAAAFSECGFRRAAFHPCYGLAEATLIVSGISTSNLPVVQMVDGVALEAHTVRPVETPSKGARAFVGCGQALDGQKILIVQPDSLMRCSPERIGEIWVSSPSVAQGYWGRPEETAQIFQAYLRDTGEGPFLRTGDLGFLKDGELFVTGRLKDLMIIRGRNHYPQDIERVVADAHPALKANLGAAFSIYVAGEEKLIVVQEVDRRYLQQLNPQEVFDAIRQAVVETHALSVYAIGLIKPLGLPRTSSGKIQRHLCRVRFLEGALPVIKEWRVSPQALNETDTPARELALAIEDWLTAQIAQRLRIGAGEIDPNQSIARYGVDSLEAASLALDLETKLNRSLPESLLWDYSTIRSLAQYLAQAAATANPEATDDIIQRFQAPRLAVSSLNPRHTLVSPPPPRPHPVNASPSSQSSFGKQRLALLNERYEDARAKDRYFYQPVITEQSGAWVVVEGRRLLMMASYSYLGLLRHPKINRAAQAAVAEFGTGTHGVRLLAGTTRLHRELETTIARFKGSEAAIVFSSGYVTNVAVIATLVTKGHVVICDKLDHASIVEGCSLSQAKFMAFGHNDVADLERCLQQAGGAGKLVVVDSVFSMDGDVINLPEVVRLCKKYDAYLMVDEAHSLGVLGAMGHGIEEHFGLAEDAIDVKMGTLSKAIPSVGGYIAGNANLISALQHNARAYIFSAALPPPQVAAAKAAFDLIEQEPERVARLQRLTQRYRAGLRALGFDTLRSETPIVPIICQTEQQAFELTRACQAEALFVLPIVYPAVPITSPRLRTTITAAHDDDDVDFALTAFERAGRRCGLIR